MANISLDLSHFYYYLIFVSKMDVKTYFSNLQILLNLNFIKFDFSYFFQNNQIFFMKSFLILLFFFFLIFISPTVLLIFSKLVLIHFLHFRNFTSCFDVILKCIKYLFQFIFKNHFLYFSNFMISNQNYLIILHAY